MEAMEDPEAQAEAIETFQAITGADVDTARHVLDAHGWDVNRGVNFFLEHGMPAAAPAQAPLAAGGGSPPEHYVDAEEDFDEADGHAPSGAAVPGPSRQPFGGLGSSRPGGLDADEDAELQAALGASLQSADIAGASAGPGSSAARQPQSAPIDLDDESSEEDGDEDLKFVSSERPPAARASGQAPFAGFAPGFLDGEAGRRVRRSRPSGAAMPDPDLDSLAAVGRPIPAAGARSPLRPAGQPAAGFGAAAEPGFGALAGFGASAGFGGPGFGAGAGFEEAGFGAEGNGRVELPEGINVEEARMLEAAMLGVPYSGRLPDFSQPPPPPAEPVSPSVLRQRELRTEQDQAFQESLLADRRKAEAAAAAKRAEQEAADARRLAEVQAASAHEAYERQIAATLDALPPEPPAGEAGSLTVAVRTPGGKRFSRRFLSSEPLRTLFDYVDVSTAPEFRPGSYRLVTQFPRRVFAPQQEGSLADAGLTARQEAVFLEPL